MNVVGKVGSLISQGVYSVATPFHPFGGAVDVIVVQQQDGTFRSTPWYVRFGKFQGVLKGAEKFVRISVNGVEADFHMYLDNSGEAYFVREVDSGKSSEQNGDLEAESNNIHRNDVEVHRLEHSISDSGVAQLRDGINSSSGERLQRAESDVDRRFYDFQDEQSSLDDSDYGSNLYENLDGEQCGEPQRLDSEVVLVSVDGHVLMAPVSGSEQNTENLQLSTPQFHLGPGEGADFCEGSGEFNSEDNDWADNYIRTLGSSEATVGYDNVCDVNDAAVSSQQQQQQQQEVCEEKKERICQASETRNVDFREDALESPLGNEGKAGPTCQTSETESTSDKERADLHACTDSGNCKREDVFKSCLELTELSKQCGNADSEDIDSSSEVRNSQDKCVESSAVDDSKDGVVIQEADDGLSPSCSSDSPGNLLVEGKLAENTVLDKEKEDSDVKSVDSDSNDMKGKDEQFGRSTGVEAIDDDSKGTTLEDECNNSESLEPERTTSHEEVLTQSDRRIEISLCKNEVRAGMGSAAAAKVFDAHRVSEDEFRSNAASIMKNENLIIRTRERYFLWEKAAPIVLGMAAYGLELQVEQKDAIPVEQEDSEKAKDDSVLTPTSSGRRWRLWPIPFRRVKTLEHTNSTASSEEVFVDSESGLQNSQAEAVLASESNNESPHKQFMRTNVPTNEQIASLNLKEGQNMITFSFSTRVLGMQQVDAHIYLWKWNARIVISDVDGTITKSDVLGQFMPLVGKDWTQSGVAKLFSAIKENGYQLLFLSARAIVQAYLTRSFLLNLKQDGKALPNGPVVISPDGLFPSLYREVIRRAPHEFKIACLEDIKKLFPSDYNPFYAGFGNRDTDELSYRKIGIPKGKIFIINPKGEVAISHRTDLRSYTSLHTLVNDMFPPTSLVEQEDYNAWNYWKVPLPEIDC